MQRHFRTIAFLNVYWHEFTISFANHTLNLHVIKWIYIASELGTFRFDVCKAVKGVGATILFLG